MSEQDVAQLAKPVNEQDRTQGPAGAPVTLVEYGDYECPYCGQAHGMVREVQRRLGDRLRFVFRSYPLTNIHPHALRAHEAAEAAAAQGKFWEMHDHLFENQKSLDDVHLRQYATTLGLDVEQFDRDLAAHAHYPRIRDDVIGGQESGVPGTPAFYVNGVQYKGSYDVESLMQALEQAAR